MAELLRKEVPLMLSTFIIAFMFFDYYVYTDITRMVATYIKEWAIIIAAFAAGVGLINLFSSTFKRVQKKGSYWYLDLWLFAMMILSVVTGLMGTFGLHPVFTWMMSNVYLPIDTALYSMIMLEVISAFYRAFRIRGGESFVLLTVVLIKILADAPITGSLLPQILPLGQWLLSIPSTAGSRGILIATAIGTIGFTIRVLLGYEKAITGMSD